MAHNPQALRKRLSTARQIAKMCKEHPDEVAQVIVETPFWPKTLEPMERYERFDDDTRLGHLSVIFSRDSDAWIDLQSEKDPDEPNFSHRFRTFFGGGQSLRVRNTILLLALAIKLDNRERPQNRKD